MALPAAFEAEDEDGEGTDFCACPLPGPAEEAAEPALGLFEFKGLALLGPGSEGPGPEALGGKESSSDMVSSVSGLSLRWRFLLAPGPLVKFIGGGAGGP